MENTNNDIASILRIPSDLRISKHIETLKSLTQNVEFFSKISAEQSSDDVHFECCKVMTLEEYDEGDIIFKFGDRGEKFYIILSGSVSVKVPATKKVLVTKHAICKLECLLQSSSSESSFFEESEEYEAVQSKLRQGHVRINVNEMMDSLKQKRKAVHGEKNLILSNEEKNLLSLFKMKMREEQKILLDCVKNSEKETLELVFEDFNEIGILTTGSSFGELALISERPRAATIQARERSTFLVLNKFNFTKILGGIAEKRLSGLIRFLQQLSFFSSRSKSYLIKLAYFFQTKRYKKDQFVFKEGEPVDGVYFIREGEVTVEKKKLVTDLLKPNFASSGFLIQMPRQVKKYENVKIVIKSRFESFGGFDVIQNKEFRNFSCICSSATSEILFMAKGVFLSRVSTLDNLKEFLAEENERIVGRFEDLKEKSKSVGAMMKKCVTPSLKDRKQVVRSVEKGSLTSRRGLREMSRVSEIGIVRKSTREEIEEAGKMKKYFFCERTPSIGKIIGKQRVFSRYAPSNSRLTPF